MKAIIYARFSPRPKAKECESVESQIRECREYCVKNNHTVVGIHWDKARSGKEEDNPGVWAAIDSLKKGYVLVVRNRDRLARNVYFSEILGREVRNKQSTIQAIEGYNGDSAGDDAIRGILAIFAVYQRRVIAAKTKAAMIRHQANGRRMSHRLPYGMMLDPADDAKMIPCPEEQVILDLILDLRAEGMGYLKISKRLESDGLTCRKGFWYPKSIARMLQRAGVK